MSEGAIRFEPPTWAVDWAPRQVDWARQVDSTWTRQSVDSPPAVRTFGAGAGAEPLSRVVPMQAVAETKSDLDPSQPRLALCLHRHAVRNDSAARNDAR
jgi:hypothetical protein